MSVEISLNKFYFHNQGEPKAGLNIEYLQVISSLHFYFW